MARIARPETQAAPQNTWEKNNLIATRIKN
jgi:hypothetical protein